MTVQEISTTCGFEVICGGPALEMAVEGVFCCDLLSWAMSRAPAGYAWVTVMGNLNALAVAALAESACIVLAEGSSPDEATLSRAEEQSIVVLRSKRPVFETALAIHTALSETGRKRL